MSNGINNIHIVGRLGADPEVRQTNSGKSVVTLSVATKYNDQATWHRAVCFGRTADFAGEYLGKGDLVYVAGRMDYRKYAAQDGSDRTSAEIVCHTLQALGSKDRASTGRTEAPSDFPEPDGNVKTSDDFDDSLPF